MKINSSYQKEHKKLHRRIYMQLTARVHIQNVPGEKVNILGVHSIGHSKQ